MASDIEDLDWEAVFSSPAVVRLVQRIARDEFALLFAERLAEAVQVAARGEVRAALIRMSTAMADVFPAPEATETEGGTP